MKYKVSNVSEMKQAVEKIKADNEKTYVLESARGQHYYVDFGKYDEGVVPFWVATSGEEIANPYYVEPPVIAEEETPAVEKLDDDNGETEPEIDDVDDVAVEDSDEVVALREEVERLTAENEKLRQEKETLSQNIVHEEEEVSLADFLEYVTLSDFIEFVAKHCKNNN